MCVSVDDLPVVAYGVDQEAQMSISLKLTQTFKKYDVPAIGYINEGKLYKKPGELDTTQVEMLRMWLEAGCDLGNHTFGHINYHNVSFEEYTRGIMDGEKVTRPLMAEYGKKLAFFRHPYLRSGKDQEQSDQLLSFLAANGYREAPVTIDNDDYLFALAYHRANKAGDENLKKKIGNEYVSYMEDKLEYFEDMSVTLFDRPIAQVLLFHASLLNADYADELMEMIIAHDYEFVSQVEALEDKAYESKVTKFGNWGISWLERWAISRGESGELFKGDPKTPEFIVELTK